MSTVTESAEEIAAKRARSVIAKWICRRCGCGNITDTHCTRCATERQHFEETNHIEGTPPWLP